MALKRKRSSPGLHSQFLNNPVSNTSSNALQFFFPPTKPIEFNIQASDKSLWPSLAPARDDVILEDDYSSSTPSHLSSRTRKRHRNNRPDEESVYARTLEQLYAAQRQSRQPDSHSVQLPTPPHSDAPERTSLPCPQRSTLHRFWNITADLPKASGGNGEAMAIDGGSDGIFSNPHSTIRCDDCEREIWIHDDASTEESTCSQCVRRICEYCSVRRERRMCLGCVMSA